MSKFSFLTLLFVGICVVRKISARNYCPDITQQTGARYQPGDTIKLWCPKNTNIKYHAYCRETGIWDHSKSTTECAANYNSPQVNYVPPSQQPVYIPPTSSHSPKVYSTKVCNFLPDYMDHSASYSGPFSEGSTMQLICKDKASKFSATCKDGAWIFATNACPGPYYDPAPPPAILPTYQPAPFIDTLLGVHSDLGYADTYPGHVSGFSGYPTCPYNSLYMDPIDYGKTFELNSLYSFICPTHRRQRYILALCETTGWYYDLRQCERPGGFRPYRPGRPFSQLIRDVDLPWWMIFRRGDTSIGAFEDLIFF